MREYRQTRLEDTNLILFNHDSPRRPPQFFLPIVATTIAESLRDRAYTTRLRTLDFRIDWSAADEIMDIVVDMALRGAPHEVVVASGMTVYAREVVSGIFARFGLELAGICWRICPQSPDPSSWSNHRLVEASGRVRARLWPTSSTTCSRLSVTPLPPTTDWSDGSYSFRSARRQW